MTIDSIAAFVCGKVGQFDSQSIAFCFDIINRRYEMIYDSDDWLDTIETFGGTTTANNPIVAFPNGLERIKQVKILDGDTLEPVTRQILMDTHPEYFSSASVVPGTPKYYFEATNAGVQSLFVYPPPDKVYPLFMYGKRTFTPLVSSQSPIIRNIDNTLIAFAQGDMLQKQHQYAKSQMLVQEAGALLDQLKATEKERANKPRMMSNLTVGGDSLAEMMDAVSARIRDYTQETRIMIREFLRRNYLETYDSQLWPESNIVMEVDRDGPQVILPEYVDRVVAVRQAQNSGQVSVSELCAYFATNPQIFEQTGTPVNFALQTSVGVAVLPPANESFAIVSDDNSDNGNVFINGETQGTEQSETIQLNGITEVLTGYPYDTPITIAKGITRGKITVLAATSRTFLVELRPEERERKHIRLWLSPTPTDASGTKCLLLGKRRIKPLVNDEDTPILRGMGTTLINMTTADMFDQMGNKDMAATARSKASQSLQTIVDRELKQTAYEPRVIPESEPSALDFCCNFNSF